jgi:DNA-binding transcriptional MerR regulator
MTYTERRARVVNLKQAALIAGLSAKEYRHLEQLGLMPKGVRVGERTLLYSKDAVQHAAANLHRRLGISPPKKRPT